ncbi:u5-Austrotoxin-Ht1a_1 [Trichonephila clavipes]|nr:u5-Austrotoxin-Ht1a_1 [Trichonephila clavipes]
MPLATDAITEPSDRVYICLRDFKMPPPIENPADCEFPLMSDTPPAHKCDMECNTESVPVCGNDGRTYESRCEIERAKCQGHPVEFKHRGKCIGGPEPFDPRTGTGPWTRGCGPLS